MLTILSTRTLRLNGANLPIGRLSNLIVYYLLNKDKYLDRNLYDTSIIVEGYSDIIIKNNTRWRHSGYLGNGKKVSHAVLFKKNPLNLIRLVVKNMLPKIKRLKLPLKISIDERSIQ